MKIHKRIADPVHGTIGLTELETRVVDTRVFQRLRRIKHLGLAHLVFPAADFSRFAHSLGVCHVTGKLLEALRNAGTDLSDEDFAKFRLAGLLHDIGHYPLSHALEGPVRAHLRNRSVDASILEPSLASDQETGKSVPIRRNSNASLDHEDVGRIVLEEDSELREVIESSGLLPKEISEIFTRHKVIEPGDELALSPLANLVSSDLDADRLDYLLRTSMSTGLPYGAVDLEYIISQIALDLDGRVCLRKSAMRAADHLLLARYFDTQQVAFHKTVAILEELTKDIVGQMLESGSLDIAEEWLLNHIRSGTWVNIDDSWLMAKILEEAQSPAIDDVMKVKIGALVNRKPPKLLASNEQLRVLDQGQSDFRRITREYQAIADRAAKHFIIDRGLFYVWSLPAFQLSKVGSHIPVDTVVDSGPAREKWEQSVRILADSSGIGKSETIMSQGGSLMSILSQHALGIARLYVVEPPDRLGVAAEMRPWVEQLLV